MSKHAFLGSHERIKQVQKDYARQALTRNEVQCGPSAIPGTSGNSGSSQPRPETSPCQAR